MTTTDNDRDPTLSMTELTTADRAALRRALGKMPYLPLTPGRRDFETVAELADLLSRFADTLAYYGQQADKTEQELRDLRSDVAAFRRVLGVTPVDPARVLNATPTTEESTP